MYIAFSSIIVWNAPCENVPSDILHSASNDLTAQSGPSSLSARRKFASLAIRNAPSEDSGQTAQMRMFSGLRKNMCTFVVR